MTHEKLLKAYRSLFHSTLFYVLAMTSAWAYETTLEEAQNALERGDSQNAYSRLQALELEHSGEPAFDYWLGVAALRAGEPSHALIALDRVILMQPNHAGARMERVAALLQLDQRRAAEREIERLQALSPPPEAQRAIERYQAEIDRRRQVESSPRHSARIGLDIGYDSNPQRLPSEIQYQGLIQLFINSGLKLENELERVSSISQRLTGNYHGNIPIDQNSRWLISATGQSQRYTQDSAEDYELTLAQAQLGYQRDLEAQRALTLRGSALQGWSGRSRSRLLTRWGSSAELNHPIGLDSELGWQLGAQHNRFDNSRNNYDSIRAGVQLRTPHEIFRTRLNAQLEREWADNNRIGGDLNHMHLGIGLDYPVASNQLIRADLNRRFRYYRDSSYNDKSILVDLSDQRRDRIWQARLTWLYQINADWLLEASADYERRNSSLEFFDTRRYQTQLGLRYLF